MAGSVTLGVMICHKIAQIAVSLFSWWCLFPVQILSIFCVPCLSVKTWLLNGQRSMFHLIIPWLCTMLTQSSFIIVEILNSQGKHIWLFLFGCRLKKKQHIAPLVIQREEKQRVREWLWDGSSRREISAKMGKFQEGRVKQPLQGRAH